MLVVLDNAVSSSDIRPLLPASRGCFALITSRSTLAGLVAREGAARVTLDVLSPEESVDPLATVLGADRIAADPPAALRVAELSGHLPLALSVVAEHAGGQTGLALLPPLRGLGIGARLLRATPGVPSSTQPSVSFG